MTLILTRGKTGKNVGKKDWLRWWQGINPYQDYRKSCRLTYLTDVVYLHTSWMISAYLNPASIVQRVVTTGLPSKCRLHLL